MTESELEAIRIDMRAGFQAIEKRLDDGFQRVDEGIADTNQALHGLMFKLLTPSEINEVRSKMKNAPDMKNFPFWAIR